MTASQLARITGIGLCFLLPVSHARAASLTDRYEMRVALDPLRARIAVSGVVSFPTPVPASGPLQLTLGRGMVSPSFEVLRSGSAERASWSVVDSTEDDYVWGVTSSALTGISGVRFRYEASSVEPRYLFYVGPEFAFAESNAHSWYPRRLDALARGDIDYEVPAGWTVVSTGIRTSSSGDSAAGRFRFTASFASELWFAVARFSSYRLAGTIPVSVYTVSPGIDSPLLARRASRTLGALQRIFGRFPYPALSLIEVPSGVAEKAGGFNGIGASGAIAFETSFLQPFHLAHVAHELGHQWWGQSLARSASSARGDYVLDEAMTEYGALEVVEVLEGAVVAEEYRRRDLPRAAGGGNYGAVEYLKLAAAGYDTVLCCLPDRPTSYRLARSKGARAWYAIGERLGHDRFDRALAHILEKRAHSTVTWNEFLSDLSRELGPDTDGLVRQWFEREGVPRWDVTWTQERGSVTAVITQPSPPYDLDLEAEIVTVKATRSRTVRLTGPVTRYVFAEVDTLIDLRVDPYYRVLHCTPEYAAEATALIPDTQARLLLQEGRTAEAETLLVHALARVTEPDVYGATFLYASTLARFAEQRRDWKSAAALAERAIAAPSRRPDILPFTYLRLARVSAKLDRWERAVVAARAALAADAASGSLAKVSAECERLLSDARRHGVK
jgi:hypothetical protein